MSSSAGSSVNYGTVSSSPPPEAIPYNDIDVPKCSHKNDGLSPFHTFVVILSLAGITFSASVSTGLLTLGLPTIAKDLQLPDNLMIWPSAAYSLASGCCLLLAGSIADQVGDRLVNLTGTCILGVFVLLNGLASNSSQLIAFRAIQGIGLSMCLPTSVSIMARALPPGRTRSIGFSCLGVAQPIGWSLGLVVEGGIERLTGDWRMGYHICAGILAVLFLADLVYLPADLPRPDGFSLSSVASNIDWIGALLANTGFGLILYCSAILTESTEGLWQNGTFVLFTLALTLPVAFFWWMSRQERLKRPALIPNSIWSSTPFLAISLTVLLAYASLQSSELFLSLFFQKVQQVTPMEASLRLLPNVVVGFILNPATGLFLQHFTAYKLLAGTSLVAAASPLLMVVIDPGWSWWVCAFWAVALGPVSVDVLFTVAHLVVTDIFPENMHALAGAVFNTVAQLGTSLGMSVIAIVSSSVISSSPFPDKHSPEALMAGYRAAFALCFTLTLLSAVTSLGLRSVGRLGVGKTQSEA